MTAIPVNRTLREVGSELSGAKSSRLPMAPRAPRRMRLGSARTDRLYFAQVREDPMLEIDALQASGDSTTVVVSSGGCTALSLLARGAGRVVAVDLNITQNHLVELKAAALRALETEDAIGFLGGSSMHSDIRRLTYGTLRGLLSDDAARFWDKNAKMISAGVLTAGVSERFIRVLAGVVRTVIHPRSRIDRLLACRTLAEQRELYDGEWNNRRWRMLFTVLLNRRAVSATFDPGFFENVSNRSFAEHFKKLLEHALCDIPVATNYFLHHMLRGEYPVGVVGGVPPYLEPESRATLRRQLGNLEVVDAGYADFLETCEDGSVDGFALSNICEWLDPLETERLFSEITRVAKPGARVCFRNFVGYTEVPVAFSGVIREDREVGRAAIRGDRSCLQSRIAICRVEK